MKTPPLLGALAAAMALMVAAPAQAQSAKDIFEKYGLLGVFAWDCGKPASPDNWVYVNRLVDGGFVQRDLMLGPSTRAWVTMFHTASEPKPNEIVISGSLTGRIEGKTVDSEPVSGVWLIEKNRMKILSSTFQGKPLIVNGMWHGRELPWMNKCD